MRVNPCRIKLNGQDIYFDRQGDGSYRISHRYSVISVEIYPEISHLPTKNFYWQSAKTLGIFFDEIHEYYFSEDNKEW